MNSRLEAVVREGDKMKRLFLAAGVMGCALLAASVSMAQTYTGDLIFNQGDFRQFELVGTAPITGGTSNGQLVLTSSGGTYNDLSSGNKQESMNWSISVPVSAVEAMFNGTTTTQYSGYFTDTQNGTTQTYIGASTITGTPSGNSVVLTTSNGELGVGGVNPANIPIGTTPNVANFNWTMTFSATDLQNFLNH
jgi:hypothetical protein